MSALAWWLMQSRLVGPGTANAKLKDAIGRDIKGRVSPILYGIDPLRHRSFTASILYGIDPLRHRDRRRLSQPWLADAFYVAVALIWLVPNTRIERLVAVDP